MHDYHIMKAYEGDKKIPVKKKKSCKIIANSMVGYTVCENITFEGYTTDGKKVQKR